jgi:rubrerythrin
MSTSNDQTNIILFLDVCSRIEGMCAELYHFYSDIFKDDEDCFHLWKKTALEEENHQKLCELASKLAVECKFEVVADYEKASRIYRKLTSLLTHVKETPPDIYLAITKAIEMENALADLHLDSAIKFNDDQIKNMFTALQGHDADHLNSLRQFQSILFLSKTEMTG